MLLHRELTLVMCWGRCGEMGISVGLQVLAAEFRPQSFSSLVIGGASYWDAEEDRVWGLGTVLRDEEVLEKEFQSLG